MEQLEEMLRDRDGLIEELEKQIGDRAESVKSVKSTTVKKQIRNDWYRPIKGDLIDELIAKFFNAMKNPIPIKRLGDGFYIFGTRKIFVKLMNGKLVVRVGGGFMSIEEFLEQYAEMEYQKVQQMIENGTFNLQNFENCDQLVEVSPVSKYQYSVTLMCVQRKEERA